MASPVAEFEQLLNSLLEAKAPGVSGSKIRRLTEIAVNNVQSESVLIQKLFTHFKRTPGTHKLGVLYIVDAIVRAYVEDTRKNGVEPSASSPDGTCAAGVYQITGLIENLMADITSTAPKDQAEKIRKVVDIWERAATFPPHVLNVIRQKYLPVLQESSAPSQSNPSSTTPPGSPPAKQNVQHQHVAAAPPPVSVAPSAQPPQNTAAILEALTKMAKTTDTSKPVPNVLPPNFPGSHPVSNPTPIQQQPPPPIPSFPGGSSMSPPVPNPLGPFPYGAPNPPQPNPAAAAAPANPQQQQQLALIQLLLSQGVPFPQIAALLAGQGAPGASPTPPGWPQQQLPKPDSVHHDFRSRSRSRSPPGHGRRRSPDGYRRRSPPGRSHSPSGRFRESEEEFVLRPREIIYDRSIKPKSIQVQSRTLFVGGVSNSMGEQQLQSIFEQFGKVQSIILNKEKRHAFVKMYTRADAEICKLKLDTYENTEYNLRTRWGVGFGPRDCSDYQTGISVIPLSRLTEADKRWLQSAEYGGTGGRPIEEYMSVEEPDIEIGAGVSSKAISRRMPTNSGKMGPRSTRAEKKMQQQQQFEQQITGLLGAAAAAAAGGGGGVPPNGQQQQQPPQVPPGAFSGAFPFGFPGVPSEFFQQYQQQQGQGK